MRAPLLLVVAVAVWALCHPYSGLVGDATMYIGRVLADRDPSGLGRDIAFAYDGQSRFSLFPTVIAPLVALLGASRAAMVVAMAGSACFVLGLGAFARSIATGRVAIAVMLAIAVLPVGYGDAGVLGFGETMAIPRPFTEGAILGALGAMLAGRSSLSIGLLLLALALHPILAMAGVGVAAIVFWVRLELRWRGPVAGTAIVVACVAIALGSFGAPLLDRLVTRVDPDWFGIIVTRSPYLFPTLWSASAFSPIVAQVATILVAAHLSIGTRRIVLVAVVVSGLIQVAVSALFADTLHILLALQAQCWRATWLIAVVGGASLVLCAADLWHEGAKARVVLALLLLAWFFQPSPLVVAAICVGALALRHPRIGAGLNGRHVILIAAAVAILSLLWALGPLIGYLAFLRAMPAGAPPSLIAPLRNNLHTLPAMAALGLWLLSRRRPSPAAGLFLLAGFAFGSTALAAMVWDQRTPFHVFVETRQDPAGLAALAAGRPDEVLWIGALAEPWTMLGRRQYLSPQQGVGIVFSRPLAIEWRRRADVLVRLGLAPHDIFTPWRPPAAGDRVAVSDDALAALCAAPDAPGLIVLPIRDGESPRAGGVIWRLPAPDWTLEPHAGPEWRETRGWTALPCGPARLGRHSAYSLKSAEVLR